jgi:hypothetical protein
MSDIIKAQQGFARKAETNRTHRFEDLYHLLCKREWIEEALQLDFGQDDARWIVFSPCTRSAIPPPNTDG